MRRARLDAELVRRGLVRSRDQAGEAIAAGRVRVGGSQASRAATAVDPGEPIVVDAADAGAGAGRPYASRGGTKLAAALAVFAPGPAVAGRVCLDAGASTGGFTDVLLRAGAVRVHAVDVGYGQLAWGLRRDPRVVVHERCNVRHLRPALLGGPVGLTVADLSFISLRLVLPALAACTDGDLLVLVKPQFEAGRAEVHRGGVVRDEGARLRSVLAVAVSARLLGLEVAGAATSPLRGPAGNVEYFLWLRPAEPGRAGLDDAAVAALLAEGGPG